MNPNIVYYESGNKWYEEYYNDLHQLHNENGPAMIIYYPNGIKYSEHYFINGKIHNTKGPAKIFFDLNGHLMSEIYYLNNKEVVILSNKEFQKYIKRLNIS